MSAGAQLSPSISLGKRFQGEAQQIEEAGAKAHGYELQVTFVAFRASLAAWMSDQRAPIRLHVRDPAFQSPNVIGSVIPDQLELEDAVERSSKLA
jgi:hypothetical protein